MDTRYMYLPFYFKGYRMLSILFPGIWDTVFNIWVTFRDIEFFGKLIMGIFASLYFRDTYLPVYLQGYGIFDTPLYKPLKSGFISTYLD